MDFSRIYPGPDQASATASEVAAAMRADAEPLEARPYVALNFATTMDGRITIGGRSGPIGNEADRELFHELRAQAHAVMAGAGTVGGERYGRLVRDPERRERRRAAGLDPDPLAIVVSARLTIDAEVPLLQDADSRVVIVTASTDELEGVRARVDYLRPPAPREGAAELALAPVLVQLRERYGVDLILCEGGSVLAGGLLREGLVDALLLSLAPTLAGGSGPTLVTAPPLEPPVEMRLATAHEAGGHLFLRYVRPR